MFSSLTPVGFASYELNITCICAASKTLTIELTEIDISRRFLQPFGPHFVDDVAVSMSGSHMGFSIANCMCVSCLNMYTVAVFDLNSGYLLSNRCGIHAFPASYSLSSVRHLGLQYRLCMGLRDRFLAAVNVAWLCMVRLYTETSLDGNAFHGLRELSSKMFNWILAH